jgi:hypothetical protein
MFLCAMYVDHSAGSTPASALPALNTSLGNVQTCLQGPSPEVWMNRMTYADPNTCASQVLALDWRTPEFCIAFVWDATDIQPTEMQ